jgi:hypothetical protein
LTAVASSLPEADDEVLEFLEPLASETVFSPEFHLNVAFSKAILATPVDLDSGLLMREDTHSGTRENTHVRAEQCPKSVSLTFFLVKEVLNSFDSDVRLQKENPLSMRVSQGADAKT